MAASAWDPGCNVNSSPRWHPTSAPVQTGSEQRLLATIPVMAVTDSTYGACKKGTGATLNSTQTGCHSSGERRKQERQMTDLSSAASKRPMLRVAGGVILVFCLSVPLVWVFSNLVVHGILSFGH
jgi:hypothetical protein